MIKVADLLKRDANIFDALRLIAATMVIYSHSYALTGFVEPNIQGVKLGTIGVYIFFILSGLLISASWANHPRVGAFIGKRLLRIWPALAFVVFVSVFIVGPLLTNLSLKAYFSSNVTYDYLNNATIFGIKYPLPGVFVSNIYAGAVNGSLWTLPYEFAAYLLVAFLGRSYLLKKREVVVGLYLACIAGFVLTSHVATNLVLFTFGVHLLMGLWAFFAAGMLLYAYKDKIVLVWQGAIVSLVLLALSVSLHHFQVVSFITLPYLVLYLGSHTKTGLQYLSKYGDFSYGMYIYAFFIQQIIMSQVHHNIGPKHLFAYAFCATLAVSVLSWHLIEKPMLGRKIHFSKEKYPILQDAW